MKGGGQGGTLRSLGSTRPPRPVRAEPRRGRFSARALPGAGWARAGSPAAAPPGLQGRIVARGAFAAACEDFYLLPHNHAHGRCVRVLGWLFFPSLFFLAFFSSPPFFWWWKALITAIADGPWKEGCTGTPLRSRTRSACTGQSDSSFTAPRQLRGPPLYPGSRRRPLLARILPGFCEPGFYFRLALSPPVLLGLLGCSRSLIPRQWR